MPAGGHDTVLLAAYGTLMRGQTNRLAPSIQAALTYRGDCLIPGVIHRLVSTNDGAAFPHPGLIHPSDHGEVVRGEVFQVGTADVAAADVLSALDEYEDFRPDDPEGSLYLRNLLNVWLPDRSARVPAWVYVYNRPVAADDRIESGDWRTE